jgi:hypothetical protein
MKSLQQNKCKKNLEKIHEFFPPIKYKVIVAFFVGKSTRMNEVSFRVCTRYFVKLTLK